MLAGNCVFSVMLADNAAGVQGRCRASSHCSVHSRDRSASWLAMLQWTLFRQRRRRSRQRVPKAVSLSRHGIQHAISGVHLFPGSAETLAMRGGITNYRLIAYSLSNISAKNYQNQLMCIEIIVCNISVVFLRHSVQLHLHWLAMKWRVVYKLACCGGLPYYCWLWMPPLTLTASLVMVTEDVQWCVWGCGFLYLCNGLTLSLDSLNYYSRHVFFVQDSDALVMLCF